MAANKKSAAAKKPAPKKPATKKPAAKVSAAKQASPKAPAKKPAVKAAPKAVAAVAKKPVAKKAAPKAVAKKAVAAVAAVAKEPVAKKAAPKAAAKKPAPKVAAKKAAPSRAASLQQKLAAVIKEGPRAVVEQVFNDAGWSFATEELAEGLVAFRVDVGEDIREVRAILDPGTSRFRLYFVFEVVAPEDRRHETAIYVTLANADLSDGNFELALDTGEVRYKTSLDFCAVDLSPYLVRNMIFHAMELTEIYGPGLVEVAEAGRAPQDAIDEAEGL
jgi:hypothetical protein